MLTLLALLLLGFVTLKVLRATRAIATRMSRCEVCGQHAPTAPVHFMQNTGMLILRQYRELRASVCRGCGLREGAKMTAHTLVLGWWGTISFVLNCLFVPADVAQLLWVASLPSSEAVAGDVLSGQQEYARNLLATKDRQTVIDVLVRTSGASPAAVDAFLTRLEAERS